MLEDEQHALFECTASGASAWLGRLQTAWAEAMECLNDAAEIQSPPEEWFVENRWKLRVGIIPRSAWGFLGQAEKGISALRKLHIKLVSELAEVMRTRGELYAKSKGEAVETGEYAMESMDRQSRHRSQRLDGRRLT